MDKETWERALEKIFCDIFLDQLHKQFKDFESEVAHVHQYLQSNDGNIMLTLQDWHFKSNIRIDSDIN